MKQTSGLTENHRDKQDYVGSKVLNQSGSKSSVST